MTGVEWNHSSSFWQLLPIHLIAVQIRKAAALPPYEAMLILSNLMKVRLKESNEDLLPVEFNND